MVNGITVTEMDKIAVMRSVRYPIRADRVRELYQLRGFESQEALAKAVTAAGGTLSQQQAGAILLGNVKRPGSLNELAKVLGTSADYLVGRTDDRNPVHSVEIQEVTAGHTIDTADEGFVRLWVLSAGDGRGLGDTIQIVESEDSIPSHYELKTIKSAFAVRVWDDGNAPWMPRGMTLYVDPSQDTGALNAWCIFAHRKIRDGKGLEAPVLGILKGINAASWRVQRGQETITLPRSEYKVVWKVAFFKQ